MCMTRGFYGSLSRIVCVTGGYDRQNRSLEVFIIEIHTRISHQITLPQIFDNKTTSYCKFIEDYDSGEISKVVDAMNNIDIISNNILCPWSCSTNFQESGSLALDLMVQKMLPKIILPLYSSYIQVIFFILRLLQVGVVIYVNIMTIQLFY